MVNGKKKGELLPRGRVTKRIDIETGKEKPLKFEKPKEFTEREKGGLFTKGGDAIGIELPDGRVFLGLSPKDVASIQQRRGLEDLTPFSEEEQVKKIKDFDLETAKADIRKEGIGKEDVEIPEGKEGTDTQKERGLREKGLITIQTGVDEQGFPLTSVITFEQFKEQSLEAGKSEGEALGEFLALGAIASPSAVVGGIPSAVKITKPPIKVGKGKTASNILKGDLNKAGIKILEKDRQIKTIRRTFRVDTSTAEKLYNLYQVTTTEKILGFMTNPKTWKWIGAGFLGTSLMTAWLGSDNVLSSSAFTMIKLRDAVESGQMSKAEALEESDEIQKYIDTGRSVVNIMTRINPFLWPSRATYMANADKAQRDFDLELRRIVLFEAEET